MAAWRRRAGFAQACAVFVHRIQILKSVVVVLAALGPRHSSAVSCPLEWSRMLLVIICTLLNVGLLYLEEKFLVMCAWFSIGFYHSTKATSGTYHFLFSFLKKLDWKYCLLANVKDCQAFFFVSAVCQESQADFGNAIR
jgi:hypothetical protein